MMSLLEKMQEMTRDLNAEELLKAREEEIRELEEEVNEVTECEIYRNYFIFNDEGLTRALDLQTGLDINNRDKSEVIRLIDLILETRIKDAINKLGRYEKNKNEERYTREVARFENEKEFLNIYEDIAKQESYTVKIEFEYDEFEGYADEMTEEEFNDELDADKDYLDTLIGYLQDFEYDEIDDNRVEITCYGDKELEELDKLLDDECKRFEHIYISIMYGPDGRLYEPIKNGNIFDFEF